MREVERFLKRQQRRLNSDVGGRVTSLAPQISVVTKKTSHVTDKSASSESRKTKKPYPTRSPHSVRHASDKISKLSTRQILPKKSPVIIGLIFVFAVITGVTLIGVFTGDYPVSSMISTDIRDGIFCVIAKQNDNTAVGTAFAVDSKNLLTNKHVVRDAKWGKVLIAHPKWSKPCIARIKEMARAFDLAWLELEDSSVKLTPLTISETLAIQGEDVYSFGYPGYSYEISNGIPEITMDKGIIKATHRIMDGTNPCYETSATINSGNSGGPLVNNEHEVIGVNSFGIDSMENCFYAIRIDVVKIAFPALWNRITK